MSINTNATRLIRGTILRCTDGKWSDNLPTVDEELNDEIPWLA
jgi:hypothetical protein